MTSDQVAQAFIPVGSWKPPKMERAQALWAVCSTAQLSSLWKVLPHIKSKHFFFSLCPQLLVLPPHTAIKSLASYS